MDKNKKRMLANISINVFVYFFTLLVFVIITLALGYSLIAFYELVIVIVLFIYHNWRKKAKNREVINYLESLAFYVDSATRDSVLNFPLPMIVLDASGMIIWYNNLFSSIIKDENVFEQSVHTVLPDISIQKIIKENKPIDFFTYHNDRFYQVIGNIVTSKQSSKIGKTIILYLVDRTNEHNLEQTLIESEPVWQ